MNHPERLPDHSLQIRLLGGFNCALRGRPVAGTWYDKMRALLAYLAVERVQDHKREVLAELLWGGNDPVTARGNLRRTLSDLRRVLELPDGRPLFLASRNTIRFLPQGWVDVIEFDGRAPISSPGHDSPQAHGERVAELYRGEFMAGFYLPDCPDFEAWLLVQREAMHRRALAGLEQLANLREPTGNHGKALQFALRYAELEPWDEAAHRRVMRLYALSGQTAAALGQFDACCRVLQKELGVVPSAETRQLAERIRNAEVVRDARDVAVGPRPPIAPPPAQRRQVTVLYCELVPSGVDDPDDAMELLVAPRAHVVEIIRRLSGYLVPMHGGGLLAYFGYPQSREDSAVHAVQAALAIAREAFDGIEIRSGVHTGLIMTGSDPSLPDTVGKTSGVAIRLRNCIGRNEAAISEETHRIVAGYFDCTSLGSTPMPDSTRPLEVFRVERESGARTRLDAAARLTPLVGRQAELLHLTRLWDEATQGVGHAVLVQGDPGIGKSRLVHAFRQRLAGHPHAIRELRCFPEYSQSPFHPLLAMLEASLGFAAGDAPELKSTKLARYVEATCPTLARDAVPLLDSLYSLPPPALQHAPRLAPQEQKELTIKVFRAMLAGSTARLPMLVIVEDLQWADPSTLDFLATLVEQKGPGPMLAIFTVRSGFTLPRATSVLPLAPLGEREMEQLIALVNGDLPAATVRRIVERVDGVPLFAEELAKTATHGDWAGIPGTLHDVLAARMDQLGEAKYAAQMAATIGREFSVELLGKVSPHGPDALAKSLGQLKESGLVLEVDEATCQFKHALIQEAAYQSQSRADRRAAHLRIARVLQGDFPGEVETRPELLAQHYSSAGETRQSIPCWIRAGQRAIHGSANLEAIAHFNCALRWLMTLPAAPDRDQTEFSILVGLCPALHATQGYGSEEATRVTARVSALRERVGDSRELFQAEWTRLRNTVATLGPRGVPQAAMRLLDLARDDPIGRQAAHYVAAVSSFWLGEFEASRLHAAQAIALYRPDQHAMMLERFGEDLSVSYAGHLSWALCFLGFADQAHQVCGRMLEQARAMEHPKTLAMALLFASMLPRWLNKYAQTLSLSAEAIAVTRQHGMSHWIATSEALHGWAQVMHEGRQDLSELGSLAVRLSAASPSYSALRLSGMAEVHMHLKLHHEALGFLARAQDDEASSGSCQFAAERHRLQGVCLLAISPPDAKAAEAAFNQALAISRRQSAKTLELRAAISMARLWQQQGKKEQARHLLAKTYDWFTEGFDAPDLVEAADLLRAPIQMT